MNEAQVAWVVFGIALTAAGTVLMVLDQGATGFGCLVVAVVGYIVLGWMIVTDRRAPGPE